MGLRLRMLHIHFCMEAYLDTPIVAGRMPDILARLTSIVTLKTSDVIHSEGQGHTAFIDITSGIHTPNAHATIRACIAAAST
jgi:hypothetical protein